MAEMNPRIGVDPGLGGAVAYIYGDHVEVWDMPVVPRRTGKGREVCAALLHNLVNEIPTVHAYVERVSAMPGQGVTSMFSLGRSLGIVEATLACCEFSYVLVTPSVWKRRAGLIGKPKDASRTLAIQMYPQLADQLKRKKDVGRADALLIAHFGEA